MSVNQVAIRYANALFLYAQDTKNENKVFSDLRAICDLFNKEKDIQEFFHSPVIQAGSKEESLRKALEGKGLCEEVESFLYLLAKKNRLGLFEQIFETYQQQVDETNGVTRGEVQSTAVLSPDERAEIEDIVSRVTKKRVILTYKENPELIGGLIANVGSYTFDDTISSHLRRLNEDLKRRAH